MSYWHTMLGCDVFKLLPKGIICTVAKLDSEALSVSKGWLLINTMQLSRVAVIIVPMMLPLEALLFEGLKTLPA